MWSLLGAFKKSNLRWCCCSGVSGSLSRSCSCFPHTSLGLPWSGAWKKPTFCDNKNTNISHQRRLTGPTCWAPCASWLPSPGWVWKPKWWRSSDGGSCSSCILNWTRFVSLENFIPCSLETKVPQQHVHHPIMPYKAWFGLVSMLILSLVLAWKPMGWYALEYHHS